LPSAACAFPLGWPLFPQGTFSTRGCLWTLRDLAHTFPPRLLHQPPRDNTFFCFPFSATRGTGAVLWGSSNLACFPGSPHSLRFQSTRFQISTPFPVLGTGFFYSVSRPFFWVRLSLYIPCSPFFSPLEPVRRHFKNFPKKNPPPPWHKKRMRLEAGFQPRLFPFGLWTPNPFLFLMDPRALFFLVGTGLFFLDRVFKVPKVFGHYPSPLFTPGLGFPALSWVFSPKHGAFVFSQKIPFRTRCFAEANFPPPLRDGTLGVNVCP